MKAKKNLIKKYEILDRKLIISENKLLKSVFSKSIRSGANLAWAKFRLEKSPTNIHLKILSCFYQAPDFAFLKKQS